MFNQKKSKNSVLIIENNTKKQSIKQAKNYGPWVHMNSLLLLGIPSDLFPVHLYLVEIILPN